MEKSGSDQHAIYLHGDLDLKIIEAKHLPNLGVVFQHLRRCFTACNTIKTRHKSSGPDVDHHRKIIARDPYVEVSVYQVILARTRVVKNTKNPVWNQHFHIPLAHPVFPVKNLTIQVKDEDVLGDKLIGTLEIPAQRIASGEPISGWFPVLGFSNKQPGPEIRLELNFTPFEDNPAYMHGIASDPEHKGVRHTYFPLRRGSSVRLYQDAHMPEKSLPMIVLDGGKVYQGEKCWEDICYAISEAHHLIYIVGWSIYHMVKLVRERSWALPRGGELTLGELLKFKSQEGVRVLLLVWDDKTSRDSKFCKVRAENIQFLRGVLLI